MILNPSIKLFCHVNDVDRQARFKIDVGWRKDNTRWVSGCDEDIGFGLKIYFHSKNLHFDKTFWLFRFTRWQMQRDDNSVYWGDWKRRFIHLTS